MPDTPFGLGRIDSPTPLTTAPKALCLSALLACALSAQAGTSSPIGVQVRTDLGWLQGEARSTGLRFQGLPFAAPPVGELRWRPPVAPAAWSGEIGRAHV